MLPPPQSPRLLLQPSLTGVVWDMPVMVVMVVMGMPLRLTVLVMEVMVFIKNFP
jgi:hypothetical protein